MPFPVVDQQFVIYVQSHTIVRRRIKTVVILHLWNKISHPAHRKMIRGSAFGEASISPVKINPRVRPDQRWLTLKFLVPEIFAFQARLSARYGHEVRLAAYNITRTRIR